MPDFLSNLGSNIEQAMTLAMWLIGLMAACAVMLILRTTLDAMRPFGKFARWMCGVVEGNPPGPSVAGFFHGLRILLWSFVIGCTTWLASYVWGMP